MSEIGHNKPPRAILELDDELYEFILENCDSNIQYGLVFLQKLNDGKTSQETLEKMVATIEKFRKLKTAVWKAGGEI